MQAFAYVMLNNVLLAKASHTTRLRVYVGGGLLEAMNIGRCLD